MIAKRKARRKEPADEEVVVCVPFSLGISNEAIRKNFRNFCCSINLSLSSLSEM
jgi:hypothetical protein